jgi:hypothetical protein
MESRLKLSREAARALEHFLKTLDRFGLMCPYLVTVEMKPAAYLNRYSNIEYSKPERVYGCVIRIMDKDGTIMRITIDDQD